MAKICLPCTEDKEGIKWKDILEGRNFTVSGNASEDEGAESDA